MIFLGKINNLYNICTLGIMYLTFSIYIQIYNFHKIYKLL